MYGKYVKVLVFTKMYETKRTMTVMIIPSKLDFKGQKNVQ